MRRVLLTVIVLGLMVVGASIDWKGISIDGLQGALNDQVGYIAVARHWADGDGLRSSFVYPSLLQQNVTKSTFYMPGFYWALGSTFKLFGYSVVTARIPSLVAYLMACALTWWVTRRVYGNGVAGVACALFAFFPMCLVFAYTAMAEMAVVAAGLAGFAIFLWGMRWESTHSDPSQRKRWMSHPARAAWLAPLALIVPLLFRETGVVVGVVMLALLLEIGGARRWRVVVLTAVLMLAAIGMVLESPIAAGRPTLWKANILAGGDPRVLYADAYAMEQLPTAPLDWVRALGRNLADNTRNLLWTTEDADGWAERSAIWFLLTGIPLGVFLGWREQDWFAWGVSAATLVLLVADLSCYDIWGYRGVRALLVMEPFVAMLWAKLLTRWLGDNPRKQALLVAAVAVAGVLGATLVWRGQAEADADTLQDMRFMESVAPDVGRLLVSPFDVSLGYVNAHYPTRWAFPASDCRSLRLLNEREEIGTLILRVGEVEKEMLDGCGLPLRIAGDRPYRGTSYRILRR